MVKNTNDYKFRPLDYLLSLSDNTKTEESFLNINQKNARNLALYFLLINIMQETNIPFFVKGGIISYYYLKDHARETCDIDIIIGEDSDSFYKKLGELLNVCKMDFSFFITKYEKIPPSDKFYYDEFYFEIEVKYKGEVYDIITIDGVVSPIFKETNGLLYQAPKIIKNGFSFFGVELEYILAEKIIAITNELSRPYKHLVDVYSMINVNINIDLLKKYLLLINQMDNEKRLVFNKEIKDNNFYINDNKEFIGSFILAELNAGYNISFTEMKEEINNWLAKFIN